MCTFMCGRGSERVKGLVLVVVCVVVDCWFE